METTAPAAPVAAPESQGAPTEAAPNTPPQKFKVKVYDQEQDVTLDELTKSYQMRQASDKRFQEATRKEKEAQSILAEIEKDPVAFARKRGMSLDQLWSAAEPHMLEKLRLEQMTPAERRAYDLEKENEKYKEKESKNEQELAEKEKKELEYKAGQQIDFEIASAAKELGIGIDAEMVAEIADIMYLHLDTRDEALSAKDAFTILQNRIRRRTPLLLDKLPDDELLAALPKETLARIRKLLVDQALSQDHPRRQANRQASTQPAAKPKKMTTDQYFEQLEQKFR